MGSVDRGVVRARLDRLMSEVEAIEARTPAEYAAFAAPENEGLRYELEHRLLVAIQAMLDSATHIAVISGIRPLEAYRDSVVALSRLEVIPAELGDRLVMAAGMRNLLVHGYQATDIKRVYGALQMVSDLARFAAAVWQWVEGNGGR